MTVRKVLDLDAVVSDHDGSWVLENMEGTGTDDYGRPEIGVRVRLIEDEDGMVPDPDFSGVYRKSAASLTVRSGAFNALMLARCRALKLGGNWAVIRPVS